MRLRNLWFAAFPGDHTTPAVAAAVASVAVCLVMFAHGTPDHSSSESFALSPSVAIVRSNSSYSHIIKGIFSLSPQPSSLWVYVVHWHLIDIPTFYRHYLVHHILTLLKLKSTFYSFWVVVLLKTLLSFSSFWIRRRRTIITLAMFLELDSTCSCILPFLRLITSCKFFYVCVCVCNQKDLFFWNLPN